MMEVRFVASHFFPSEIYKEPRHGDGQLGSICSREIQEAQDR
jgi:hypothetical protein